MNNAPDTLPRLYLITPDFDGDEDRFLSGLEQSLRYGIRLVQLRSKQLSKEDYLVLAGKVSVLCQRYHVHLVLNGPEPLFTSALGAGVHLPSCQATVCSKRPIPTSRLLSVACHNLAQLEQATRIDADLLVVSPIFATPSSPQGVPIGWKTFSAWLTESQSYRRAPVYALGGLTLEDEVRAKQCGAYGIAAKRALWQLDSGVN